MKKRTTGFAPDAKTDVFMRRAPDIFYAFANDMVTIP